VDALTGVNVTTLFYESSTRTRISFESAAKALGANVNSVAVASSSIGKGESLVDTVKTLRALGSNVIVLRHERAGAPWLAARVFDGSLLNAGDGWHAHPTQALLDLSVLVRHIGAKDGTLKGRRVAIIGDLLHSRVARSNLHTLRTAGAQVRLAGPAALTRGFASLAEQRDGIFAYLGFDVHHHTLADTERRKRARGGLHEITDAVHIQHQCVGADQMCHQRRQSVIVAEPDLIGGDGVVLVDDRHRVKRAKSVQRARGVGVLHPL
jgi:aspartate carbamoyltransferase catalytic subunit